jgi:GntR family transcriptional regulator
VAGAIEQRIRSGAHVLGSLLPVDTDLAKMFGVSRQTVRRAITHLRDRGRTSKRAISLRLSLAARTGANGFNSPGHAISRETPGHRR